MKSGNNLIRVRGKSPEVTIVHPGEKVGVIASEVHGVSTVIRISSEFHVKFVSNTRLILCNFIEISPQFQCNITIMSVKLQKIPLPNLSPKFHWNISVSFTGILLPGRVAQSVTCLATDACLTADPGVASSIPVRSHTFVEIDYEMISTVILLPSADSFKKGCCQLQAKVCARITG